MLEQGLRAPNRRLLLMLISRAATHQINLYLKIKRLFFALGVAAETYINVNDILGRGF